MRWLCELELLPTRHSKEQNSQPFENSKVGVMQRRPTINNSVVFHSMLKTTLSSVLIIMLKLIASPSLVSGYPISCGNTCCIQLAAKTEIVRTLCNPIALLSKITGPYITHSSSDYHPFNCVYYLPMPLMSRCTYCIEFFMS